LGNERGRTARHKGGGVSTSASGLSTGAKPPRAAMMFTRYGSKIVLWTIILSSAAVILAVIIYKHFLQEKGDMISGVKVHEEGTGQERYFRISSSVMGNSCIGRFHHKLAGNKLVIGMREVLICPDQRSGDFICRVRREGGEDTIRIGRNIVWNAGGVRR
jgi:hypothetical protein